MYVLFFSLKQLMKYHKKGPSLKKEWQFSKERGLEPPPPAWLS